MSTTTTTPDTPTSAGDGDIKAGLGRLLHETQTKTYFPIHEEKDQDQKTAASQRLTYTVSGHLTARLSTDWEIVPGFKLTSVELSVDAYYGSESINRSLSASLTANARVVGCLLSVKGEIPDLRNDEPTEFTLSLAVLYAGRRTTPEDVAGALIGTAGSSGVGTMVGRLDSDVAGALRDPAAMAGALFARMTVLHDGDSYFVKEVAVSVAARFEWAPVEAIRITDVELYLGASRSGADSEWEYAARVSGKMSIGAAVATVVAKLDVGGDGGDSSAAGSTTSAEVAVRVGEYRGVSAKDLIRTVVGEEPGSVFGEMPEGIPDAEHCFSGTSAAGEVVVEIEKGAAVAGSGWGIKSVVVRAELLDFVWKVVDGLEVQDVAFALKVERGAVTAAGVGAAGAGTVTEGSISGTENKKWVFKGPMGVTLSLQRAQFVMPVSISYGSHKDIVDIEGTLPDGGYGQMTALAADPAILALPESEGGA